MRKTAGAILIGFVFVIAAIGYLGTFEKRSFAGASGRKSPSQTVPKRTQSPDGMVEYVFLPPEKPGSEGHSEGPFPGDAPAFRLHSSPFIVTANPGGAGRMAIRIVPIYGMRGSVTLRLYDAPRGVTGFFDKPTVRLDGTNNEMISMRVAVGRSVRPGDYRLSVVGRAPRTAPDTTEFDLDVPAVQKPLPFHITGEDRGWALFGGQEITMTIHIRGGGSYHHWVRLGLLDDPDQPSLGRAGDPKKVSFSFSPAAVYGTGKSVLKIHAGDEVRGDDERHFLITATSTDGARQKFPIAVAVFPSMKHAIPM